jgi:hypothetical protein
MNRPTTVTALIAFQLIVTVAGLALTAYLIWLTRSPDILKGKDPSNEIRGLYIGALVIGLPSVLNGVIFFGLWRRARWGWWCGLALSLILAALFVYSAFDPNGADADDFALAAVPVVLCFAYLVPRVRRWFLRERSVAAVENAT